MITTLILFATVAVCIGLTGFSLLEGTLVTLIVSALFGWVLGTQIGIGAYPAAMILVIGSLLAIRGVRFNTLKDSLRLSKSWPALVWIGAFVLSFSFTQWWPDFISIGERLRDYALLSAVYNYPFEAREPWMTGAPLNYYLLWYRFGHFVGVLCSLPVWEVYNVLQSFTFASYISVLAVLANRAFGLRMSASIMVATLIAFGSNLAGIKDAFTGVRGWWGPSRVITGTINEFPAWSFLLGDLHPHFLNLPLLPLAMLLAFSLPVLVVPVFVASLFLVFAANAWEVPVALIFLVLGALALALYDFAVGDHGSLSYRAYIRGIFSRLKKILSSSYRSIGSAFGGALFIAVLAYLAAKHISPPSDPVRFVNLGVLNPILNQLAALLGLVSTRFNGVNEAVYGSPVGQFMLHWGVPLAMLSLALLFERLSYLSIVALTLGGILSYTLGIPLPFLVTLILVAFISIFVSVKAAEKPSLMFLGVCCLGVGSLIAIAIPEILFIDDPYGGENERMNTVFKFYSAAWGPLHLFAFGKFISVFWREETQSNSSEAAPGIILALLACVLSLGFFAVTTGERSQKDFRIPPKIMGLSTIEREFPGSSAIIQRLGFLQPGVILEAVFGAYNYSGFVATLSSRDSFMGWVNHVGLLTKKHEEAGRRERFARDFYTNPECSFRLDGAKREGIKYVIVGSLERQNYGEAVDRGFDCFRLVQISGQYRLYEVR